MELLNTLAAAIGSWVFGAIWYMVLAKPWVKVSGVAVDEDGRPISNGRSGFAMALPFILSFVTMIIVAGFMRHIFAVAGIESMGAGALAGLGVGLFFIAPWTMINNAYTFRPFMLTVIDGGYAVFGCTIIGAVLAAF